MYVFLRYESEFKKQNNLFVFWYYPLIGNVRHDGWCCFFDAESRILGSNFIVELKHLIQLVIDLYIYF